MKKKHIALTIGLLLSVIGLGSWCYQIVNGLGITGMNNVFSWGLYMGSFEFFIGLSSGGMLLFSIAYIWRVESLKPFVKLGAVSSLASVVAAGVAILTDLGKPFRVLQMILTPNVKSPLFWDVIVLGIYAVICFAAVLLQVLPGLKKFEGKRNFLLNCEKRSKALSYVTLPFVAVMNAVTTLMFAVQNTREWWHSAILPADSVVVAAALGLSFMMLIGTAAAGKEGYEVWRPGFLLLAKISAVCLLIHFCFTALELTTISWNGSAEGEHLLHLLFQKYGILYLLEMLLPFIAMIFYFFAKGKHRKSLAVMNGLVVAAIFIHRMMLLLPAFNSIPLTIPVAGLGGNLWTYPIASGVYQPGQDIFLKSGEYAPTLMEWGVGLLPVGIVIVVIAGSICFLSLIPKTWEKQFQELS